MTDPRFFRRYLDILDEQSLPAGVNQPATVNIDDNTSVTVDPAVKTVGMQTKVGDNLNLQATQDFSTAKQGAGTVAADYQMDPNTSVGVTATQAGYKGQMAPTGQARVSSNIPGVGKINARVDQGAMFQGAGRNVKPGDSSVTTMTATSPQGKSVTYSTNRNL